VGTSGDAHGSGPSDAARGGKGSGIDQALHKYSVSDGSEWIERQYGRQLPMLDENILD